MEVVSAATTFTFLFTDIEASTRRWEADPEAMEKTLGRHDAILRAAVAEHRGRIFKHTGDGMCSVFPTPAAAVGAAVTAQLRLGEEDWGAPGPLRVRMAVHSGVAQCRDGDYFGTTLNRAARLMATAHGGQVIASQATAEAARPELSADVALIDLGEHRLADLTRPEWVFQVTAAGLPSDFPPLRSLNARRHNLPTVASSFVGRHLELHEVVERLSSGRLVTITGSGGAGKTRLALEVAARLLSRYFDGVYFVDLASVADPDLVAARAMAALDIVGGETDEPKSPAAAFAAHVADWHALLVLDNCEHVIDAAAALTEAVLERGPAMTVLATSREPLGVPGEVVWRVPSLAVPAPGATLAELRDSDAITLFCERAGSVDTDFRLTDDNAHAVARVCRRLDGIPLALELAAARISVLSPEQIAARLDDRFRLLTGGARTALPRHRTLRAAIEWGWDLLSPAERAVLRRLSVLTGTFDLDAAEAVAADGQDVTLPDVLDLVAHLVDKSFVNVEPGGLGGLPRYVLLETVRQYSAEQLMLVQEATGARDRHLAHFARRGEEETARPFTTPLIQAAADYPNLMAALEWAAATGNGAACLSVTAVLRSYWPIAGQVAEGVQWLERALALSGDVRTPARVGALVNLGVLRRLHGDVGRAEAALGEALHLAKQTGDATAMALVRIFIGDLALHRGNLDEAERQTGLGLSGSDPSSVMAAWALWALGWAAMARGAPDEAISRFDRVIEIGIQARAADELVCSAQSALAPLAALRGDGERAAALARDAVLTARRLGQRRLLVMTLVRAAEVSVLLDDVPAAGPPTREVMLQLRHLGGAAWVADTLELAAVIAARGAQPDKAARLLGTCHALRSARGESGDLRSIRRVVERCRAETAATLGADGFELAWKAGAAVDPNDALTLELRQSNEVPVQTPT